MLSGTKPHQWFFEILKIGAFGFSLWFVLSGRLMNMLMREFK